MVRDRQFRGGMDGHRRPFDWLALARQHGVPEQEARALYEEAVRQAGGHPEPRLHEESVYLELLVDARRRAWRPSPGKVTRTMRLQAHRTGKHRGPYVSHLTGKPVAPGKRSLTSYIEPVIREGRVHKRELDPLEADTTSLGMAMSATPNDPLDALARTQRINDQEWPNRARAVPARPTRPSGAEHLVRGTIAHRRLQADLAAAFGHFEELDAFEDERIDVESATLLQASQLSDEVDGEETSGSVVNGWPPPPELQLTREWQARRGLTDPWAVQQEGSQPETAIEHAWLPALGVARQAQRDDEDEDLFPPMAVPGSEDKNWGAAGPIQAAGLREIPDVPVRLPDHSAGTEMPEKVRAKMEAAFGVDFSQVRIHEGPHAEAVGALAYTQGTHIHFAPGQYRPTSPRGQELLGHELAHVVQQSQGRVRPTTQASGVPINDDASLEREADEMGARAAREDGCRKRTAGLIGVPPDGSFTHQASPNPALRGLNSTGVSITPDEASLDREVDVLGDRAAGAQGGQEPAQASTPAFETRAPLPGAPASPAIQARRSDFQVNGEHQPGKGDLLNHVFFDRGSSTLSDEQRERLRQILGRLSEDERARIRLRGLVSEEGDREANQQLAEARIAAVARILEAEGIPASAITRNPQPMASRGQIQYRRWRAVEIVAGNQEQDLNCDGAATTVGQFSDKQRSIFIIALKTALDWVSHALSVLSNHTTGSQLPRAVTDVFGEHADLQRLIDALGTLYTGMDTRTQAAVMGTPCAVGCETGTLAYERGDQITVCPDLFEEEPLQIARLLVHESAHLDSGLRTSDVAYGHSRLARRLSRLSPEDAYRNADSYALMITALNGQTNLPGSTPVEDELSALSTEDEREAARDTLAYLERCVEEGSLIPMFVHEQVNAGLNATPVAWQSELASGLMLHVGREFHVPARRDRPLPENREVLSALYDRFTGMAHVFDNPIRVTPTNADTTTWTGNHIQATPALWRMPLVRRVRVLLRCLVANRPDVSNEMIDAYVNITERFSRVRGIFPPDPENNP
jgi:outer membrane protein OmpA-like peptidoglycan-associated protein